MSIKDAIVQCEKDNPECQKCMEEALDIQLGLSQKTWEELEKEYPQYTCCLNKIKELFNYPPA